MMDTKMMWYLFNSHGISETISDASFPLFKAYNFDVISRHMEVGRHFFGARGKWG